MSTHKILDRLVEVAIPQEGSISAARKSVDKMLLDVAPVSFSEC
jgi:hypothetical protein